MPAPPLNLVPSTELDAVNVMLQSIGQAPVNTLSVEGITDVSNARLILHNTSREVQQRGWHCNTDEELPLTPDVNGKITYPPDALSADPERGEGLDLTARSDAGVLRFYDRKEHTFVIGRTVKFTVIRFLPFETLPQSLRTHIMARAARRFQSTVVGSQILWQFTREYEAECQVEAERDELRNADNNTFDSDPTTAFIAYRDAAFSGTLR
jgi:hypothetical protein